MNQTVLVLFISCLLASQWPVVLSQRIHQQDLSVVTSHHQNWMALQSSIQTQLEESKAGDELDVIQLLVDLLVRLKSSNFPTAVATNISQQCIDDSQSYVRHLYFNTTLWALQMRESSGDLPPGLFGSANIHADGLFDECLAVRAPNFQGQYCSVYFKPSAVDPSDLLPQASDPIRSNADTKSNFVTIFQIVGWLSGSNRVEPKWETANAVTYILPSVSLCLPSSCSARDVGQAVAQLIGAYVISNISIVTVTDEQYCFKDNSPSDRLDGVDITVIVILSVLAALVISATIHEARRIYIDETFDAEKDGRLVTALHSFSAIRNGRRILAIRVLSSSADDNLGCLHGIRFLSTCWVVVGHFWEIGIFKMMNPLSAKTDALKWQMQPITNATVSVDTFFLVSGLLVSYLLLKELDRSQGRLNIGLFYLHRYLRLTPVYAIVLAFVATLMVRLATGPNWYTIGFVANTCRVDWWKQFLYVNNFFTNGRCMGQSWYLAVDMQLFVISPLLIYPIWRWKRMGLAWLALIVLASHASIFAVYAVYDLMPTVMYTRIKDFLAMGDSYFDHYYIMPWTRAPPYLVGIWTGWYLHVTKKSKSPVPKTVVGAGWLLSALVGLAVIYGLTPYFDPVKVPTIDPAVNMTYGPLHRTAWALVIAWIVFACSCGYGGFVNRFLSWKGFLPLSRLTYCVYLIHYDLLRVFFAALRKQYYYTLFVQLMTCFGAITISFFLAFILSVTFEASLLNLEKLLLSSRKNQ